MTNDGDNRTHDAQTNKKKVPPQLLWLRRAVDTHPELVRGSGVLQAAQERSMEGAPGEASD